MKNANKTFELSESLFDLVDRINKAIKAAEEWDHDENCCHAEYCQSFGYGEDAPSFENLRDEGLKHVLEELYYRDPERAKDLLTQHGSLERVDMYTQWSEVYSVPIGEQEHQFSEFGAEIDALTAKEFEYLKAKVNAYTQNGEWYTIDHGMDRWILKVDEDALIQELGVNKR